MLLHESTAVKAYDFIDHRGVAMSEMYGIMTARTLSREDRCLCEACENNVSDIGDGGEQKSPATCTTAGETPEARRYSVHEMR